MQLHCFFLCMSAFFMSASRRMCFLKQVCFSQSPLDACFFLACGLELDVRWEVCMVLRSIVSSQDSKLMG